MVSLALNQLSDHQSEDEINNRTNHYKNGEYYSRKDDDNKFIEGLDNNSVQNKHINDICLDSKTEDDPFTCYLPSNENVKTRRENSTELKSLIDDVNNILNHYPPVSLLTEVSRLCMALILRKLVLVFINLLARKYITIKFMIMQS